MGNEGVPGGSEEVQWIRFQSEQTGVDPSQVPVVHAGGLSRPLYTPASWEPESQFSDSEVEVVADQVVVPDTDPEGAFSLSAPVSREAGSLQPRPKLLTLKPKSRSAPATPSQAPAAASSSSSRPGPSRAPVPEPVNPPSSSSRPSPPVRSLAKLHPTIELYLPNGEEWNRKITEYPVRLVGERIIAIDWHQVSDVYRHNSKSCERIGERYELPRGVARAYSAINSWKRPGDLLVILSHINNSQFNKEQLLWTIFCNQPAIDLVIITQELCGVSGKLYALGALSPYCCLIDDTADLINTAKKAALSSFTSVFPGNHQRRERGLSRLGTSSSICRRSANF